MKCIYSDEEPCDRSLVFAISAYSNLARFEVLTTDWITFTNTSNLRNAIEVAADQQEGIIFVYDHEHSQILRNDFKTSMEIEVIRQFSNGNEDVYKKLYILS